MLVFSLFAQGARSTVAPVVSLHGRVSGRHAVTLWRRQFPGFAVDKKKTKTGLPRTLVFVRQAPISRPPRVRWRSSWTTFFWGGGSKPPTLCFADAPCSSTKGGAHATRRPGGPHSQSLCLLHRRCFSTYFTKDYSHSAWGNFVIASTCAISYRYTAVLVSSSCWCDVRC